MKLLGVIVCLFVLTIVHADERDCSLSKCNLYCIDLGFDGGHCQRNSCRCSTRQKWHCEIFTCRTQCYNMNFEVAFCKSGFCHCKNPKIKKEV